MRTLDPISLQEAHASAAISAVWLYRSLYSVRHEYWLNQACFRAVHTVLHKLIPGTPYVDIFVKACVVLREIGEVNNVANHYLRAIRSLLTASGIKLPQALLRSLDTLEERPDSAYIDEAYVRLSSNPEERNSSSPRTESLTVTDLIHRYGNMDVNMKSD